MKGLGRMSQALRTLLWTSVLAGISAAPAVAQIAPTGAVPRVTHPKPGIPAQRPATPARTAPDALAPTNPDFKADQPAVQAAPIPAPLPPAVWDVINAQE